MNLNDYQNEAQTTAIYKTEDPIAYLLLGLTGEAGEMANKYKKVIRGDKEFDGKVKTDLLNELGDVMWYVAMLATELDSNLSAVAIANIVKLRKRKETNAIKGDGDER